MKRVVSSFLFLMIGFAGMNVVLSQSVPKNEPQTEIVYSLSQVDEKLQINQKVKARYTDEARRNCINGKVLLNAIFRPSGKIENIEVIKGLDGGLNESAKEAIRKIKYRPARKGGQAVSVYASVEYDFDFSKILPCKNGRRN